MILKEFSQTAETPELGGDFGDMILIINSYLSSEQKKRGKKYAKVFLDKEKGEEKVYIDKLGMLSSFEDHILSLISGWKNITDKNGNSIEFNKTNVTKLLIPRASGLTGQKKTDEDIQMEKDNGAKKVESRYTLFGYIQEFASNAENFVLD